MKVLGDRISILKKEGLLSIVILANADKKKLGLLFLWLFAWTVCGLIVFLNYFTIKEQQAKLFIIVYLSFWLYFEYKIVRAFIWRKYGKEKLWIQAGKLHYQKETNGKGKTAIYDLYLISDLKVIDITNTSWADSINQSFWVKGGERLSFQYQGKTIILAMQVSDNEARNLFTELKNALASSN
jgi:hypothetical protein